MKKTAILYHANCPDGFGGAWAAWKKFGSRAEYVPLRYNIAPPEIKGKDLYMIDFCYDETEFMNRLKRNNKSLTIIDHHLSAKKNFGLADGGVLDMEHSGATLAWSYFYPDKPMPQLLRYVEDGDIWKFALPHTKEVGAWLGLYDLKTVQEFDALVRQFENPISRKKFIEYGKIILAYADRQIEEILNYTTTPVVFEGHRVLAVNSPLHRSQIGHLLAERSGTMGIVWVERANIIKVSLRSVKSFDVAKIAEKYGGGGHKNAASFVLKKGAKLPWKIYEK